ncbi:hypothetical protein CKO09_09555 [Chromatium weissei]|nr:hypothetical protein [Chromatium weissei]
MKACSKKASWKIVPIRNGLDVYCRDWNFLNLNLYQKQPFFDSRFIEPMLKYFATGKEYLCIHSHNQKVNGLLILTKRRFGIWSLFAPSQAQIAPILLKDETLLRSLLTSLSEFPLSLELINQDPLFTPIQADSDQRLIIREPHALTIAIKLTDDFEHYWLSRSKKLQQNYNRYRRRLQKKSLSMRMICHEAPNQISKAVTRYGIIESRGWKGSQGTSIHVDNVQGAFYAQLMNEFAVSGNASVYELYFNDTLVASRLCILNSEMLIMLKTTYDETFSEYAPGRLLLHAVIAQEFARKRVKKIEFYTDATQDQMSWSTEQREIQHVTLFRHPLLKKAYQARNLIRKKLR